MYNRYIRSDDGVYRRVPQEEPRQQRREDYREEEHRQERQEERREETTREERRQPHRESSPKVGDDLFSAFTGEDGVLKKLLSRFHLESLDTEDLLLLVLLLLVFAEGEDTELLIALGVLLLL